jgi:hypothetical protein
MAVNNVRPPRHIGELITNENAAAPHLLGHFSEDSTVGRDLVTSPGHRYGQIANKQFCAGAFSERVVGKEDSQNSKLPNCFKRRNHFLFPQLLARCRRFAEFSSR